jgi:hypothetical protein
MALRNHTSAARIRPATVAARNRLRLWRSRLQFSCRLHFRLIRVGSPTFAYYRVRFPTQVKDGGD